mmetsp:Transcript_16731/g.25974  ORF Transcript_16731/g.25974 Transcript_16731/m.25974 type:complete len:101 (-) Transcript_16731:288-590(-)
MASWSADVAPGDWLGEVLSLDVSDIASAGNTKLETYAGRRVPEEVPVSTLAMGCESRGGDKIGTDETGADEAALGIVSPEGSVGFVLGTRGSRCLDEDLL